MDIEGGIKRVFTNSKIVIFAANIFRSDCSGIPPGEIRRIPLYSGPPRRNEIPVGLRNHNGLPTYIPSGYLELVPGSDLKGSRRNG